MASKQLRKARREIKRLQKQLEALQGQQSQELPQWRRHLKKIARLTVLVISSSTALLFGVDQIWGPPWPKRPVLTPESGSAVGPSAWDVPFSIHNPSILFDLRDVQILCFTTVMSLSSSVGFSQGNAPATGLSGEINTLPANDTKLLKCWSNQSKNSSAKNQITMGVRVLYCVRPWPWRIKTDVDTYLWVDGMIPPRWILTDDPLPIFTENPVGRSRTFSFSCL